MPDSQSGDSQRTPRLLNLAYDRDKIRKGKPRPRVLVFRKLGRALTVVRVHGGSTEVWFRAVPWTGSQEAAIDRAREIARNEQAEVVIHGRDGKIRDSDSYGHDPFPPRGSR